MASMHNTWIRLFLIMVGGGVIYSQGSLKCFDCKVCPDPFESNNTNVVTCETGAACIIQKTSWLDQPSIVRSCAADCSKLLSKESYCCTQEYCNDEEAESLIPTTTKAPTTAAATSKNPAVVSTESASNSTDSGLQCYDCTLCPVPFVVNSPKVGTCSSGNACMIEKNDFLGKSNTVRSCTQSCSVDKSPLNYCCTSELCNDEKAEDLVTKAPEVTTTKSSNTTAIECYSCPMCPDPFVANDAKVKRCSSGQACLIEKTFFMGSPNTVRSCTMECSEENSSDKYCCTTSLCNDKESKTPEVITKTPEVTTKSPAEVTTMINIKGIKCYDCSLCPEPFVVNSSKVIVCTTGQACLTEKYEFLSKFHFQRSCVSDCSVKKSSLSYCCTTPLCNNEGSEKLVTGRGGRQLELSLMTAVSVFWITIWILIN